MARSSKKKVKIGDKKGRGRFRGKGGKRPGGKGGGRRQLFVRRKGCVMCAKRKEADYKDIEFLSTMITERGSLLGRRLTGICAFHQRQVATAVKRARILALLPFQRS